MTEQQRKRAEENRIAAQLKLKDKSKNTAQVEVRDDKRNPGDRTTSRRSDRSDQILASPRAASPAQRTVCSAKEIEEKKLAAKLKLQNKIERSEQSTVNVNPRSDPVKEDKSPKSVVKESVDRSEPRDLTLWEGELSQFCPVFSSTQLDHKAECVKLEEEFELLDHKAECVKLEEEFELLLRDGADTSELTEHLSRMDECLENLSSASPPAELLSHLESQFLCQCGTLLLKRELEEGTRRLPLTNLLFMAAWSGQVTPRQVSISSSQQG